MPQQQIAMDKEVVDSIDIISTSVFLHHQLKEFKTDIRRIMNNKEN